MTFGIQLSGPQLGCHLQTEGKSFLAQAKTRHCTDDIVVPECNERKR